MKRRAHDIAAELLTGKVGADTGMLHFSVYDSISRAAELVERTGGELKSRQAVAAIIVAWEIQHPGCSAYCEE